MSRMCIPRLQEQGSKVRVRTVLIYMATNPLRQPQRRRGGISVPRECLLVKVLRHVVAALPCVAVITVLKHFASFPRGGPGSALFHTYLCHGRVAPPSSAPQIVTLWFLSSSAPPTGTSAGFCAALSASRAPCMSGAPPHRRRPHQVPLDSAVSSPSRVAWRARQVPRGLLSTALGSSEKFRK